MAHYLFALCSIKMGSDEAISSGSRAATSRQNSQFAKPATAPDTTCGSRIPKPSRNGWKDLHSVAEAARWIGKQALDWSKADVRLRCGAEVIRDLAMTSRLRIGIDFDNTIIAYDEVFCAAAKRRGLIAAEFIGGKQAVRDAIRLLPDGELAWQRLQGQVYGKGIGEREP